MSDEGYEYIIEYHVVGKNVKVSAMDPFTLTEVSIIGPRNYSRQLLAHQAVKKLEYVMSKRGQDGAD